MQTIEIEKEMACRIVSLHCATCKTTTRHVLIKSGTVYVCGCGSEIAVAYKEKKND